MLLSEALILEKNPERVLEFTIGWLHLIKEAAVGIRSASKRIARKGRKQPRDYDQQTNKQRNLVERFIGWAQHFRRAATRYDKTVRNFLTVWNLVAIIKLLK